ncbi:MAG: flagellar hook-basal body complex protein FliE [Novosphingopyxis baekryungensis]|nr:flagellar hook-basal body complex protein FliE [Novosphingopyxis baekryungensis]
MQPMANSLLAARNAILQQNKTLQNVTEAPRVGSGQIGGSGKAPETPFTDTMRDALSQVNASQSTAADAAAAYDAGQTTDIAAVMLAKQKASVGFEATLQVRNKLLSAYENIMNMPV